jgi:predicted ferric reductase
MLFLSHLYFRRLSYEFFLILHILLAVFVIAGCWYHVILRWSYQFYDNWLYAAIAVWFFDRLVRVLRVVKNGIRRATVTEVGQDHVRVDIPGVRFASKPGCVAYAHFPTLNPLRPWENHPFSINSTALFRSYNHALAPASASLAHSSSDEGHDIEKSANTVMATGVSNDTPGGDTSGVTLIVKKSAGLTKLLKSHSGLMTLLDGPYPQGSGTKVLKCDRVLLIGGGVGITGLLPWIQAHPNIKLAWSVKSNHEPLVKELEVVLANVTNKEVLVGERLNLEALLRTEAEARYSKVGVVVCAPGSMCDEVRALVAGFGRGGKTVFELEVDAFSW